MSKLLSCAFLLSVAISMSGCNRTPAAENDAISVKNGSAAAPAGPAPAETHGQDFVSAVLGRYDFAAQSARLVAGRADRPNVKQFADKLAADLVRSREALVAAAGGKLKLKPTPVDASRTDLTILGSAHGAALETAFAERQLDNLSQLLGLIRAYGDGGDNAALKNWAIRDQALINDRLSDLQTLDAQLKETAEKKL